MLYTFGKLVHIIVKTFFIKRDLSEAHLQVRHSLN